MQILVVDDSRTMRHLVTRTLRQAGFGEHDIVEAGDGVEALEHIRSGGADIVLCDWNMPRMSGIELLKSLRSAGDSRPFGFVTTEGTQAMRELAEKEGAQFLITKPFTADVFSSVLGGVAASAGTDAPRHKLPVPADLARILETLLGRSVLVSEADVSVAPDRAAVVWSYVFPDGGLAAAGALDPTLAAVLGAGFGLLPPSRVAETLEVGALAPDLLDNLREVINVFVALYRPSDDEQMRLGEIWLRGGSVPTDVMSLLTSRTRRLDVGVRLAGYGDGLLSAVPAWRLVQGTGS